jgi:hypothetical protein
VQVIRLFLPLLLVMPQVRQPSYEDEIMQWRRDRETALKQEGGWLDVAGLYWLKPGENSVGAEASSQLVLPAGKAPARVGKLIYENGAVTFEPERGLAATINGKPAARQLMQPDTAGSPDILRVNTLTMFVIRRGSRMGVRLKDSNNPARRHFTGLKYFPLATKYRVTAKYTPYDPPRQIRITNILGETNEDVAPGYVEFDLDGRHLRLEPLLDGDELFFIFKDQTAGHETYPAGRFLYAHLPRGGEVILDFNKAINPPCAFTPYATCPLPPVQNRLPLRIEAGELKYGH